MLKADMECEYIPMASLCFGHRALTFQVCMVCSNAKYYTSKVRGVLGGGSIPIVILPSCQDAKTGAIYLHKLNMSIVG